MLVNFCIVSIQKIFYLKKECTKDLTYFVMFEDMEFHHGEESSSVCFEKKMIRMFMG